MPKTTNLNLELTDSDEVLFREYRLALNGVGEGSDKSNAQIIDEFAGKLAGGSAKRYLAKRTNDNFDFEWETADSAPTEDSTALITSDAVFKGIKQAKEDVDTGSRITISSSGAITRELKPGVFYDFTGTLSSLTLTFGTPASERENEYKGQFLSGNTVPTVTFPQGIAWIGGTPTIQANKKYQFSILDNVGVIVGV